MTGAPAAEGNQASRFRSRDDCLGRTAIVVGMDGLTPAFVAKQVSAMAAWPLLLVARSRVLVAYAQMRAPEYGPERAWSGRDAVVRVAAELAPAFRGGAGGSAHHMRARSCEPAHLTAPLLGGAPRSLSSAATWPAS
jgi:hypothetical protein